MLPSYKIARKYEAEYFNIRWGGKIRTKHKYGKVPKRFRKVLERARRYYKQTEKRYRRAAQRTSIIDMAQLRQSYQELRRLEEQSVVVTILRKP